MSALGQKQTCAVQQPMSAKCHKRTWYGSDQGSGTNSAGNRFILLGAAI